MIHGARVVGGDEHQVGFGGQVVEGKLSSKCHGAGVEAGDLGVVAVGVGEEGSGEDAGDDFGEGGVDAAEVKITTVVLEIHTDGRHQARAPAEQRQGVGDVGGNAAALDGHRLDQEGEADVVELVGQEVVLEVARELHEIVEGD